MKIPILTIFVTFGLLLLLLKESSPNPNVESKKCFSLYLPQLEKLGTDWLTGYKSCLDSATIGRESLLTNVSSVQKEMRMSALGIDTFIESCLAINDALEFFNCFAKLSKKELAIAYTISYNASQEALNLNKQLSDIEVEHYQCTNRTENDYVLGTAQVFNALDDCLEGDKDNNTD